MQAAEGVPPILQLAAKAGHLLLYIFMLVMPISGVLMSRFSGYPISVFEIFTICFLKILHVSKFAVIIVDNYEEKIIHIKSGSPA